MILTKIKEKPIMQGHGKKALPILMRNKAKPQRTSKEAAPQDMKDRFLLFITSRTH
ncbi:conserved hypothetical protein [Ricinus communis]|uniref:Uncharacterized protein n=1 Tax=Ricinus communis TaxID=3988 RepID=B9T388_RICCO|nr:conserved hypothetical protein [Ricinus communis]